MSSSEAPIEACAESPIEQVNEDSTRPDDTSDVVLETTGVSPQVHDHDDPQRRPAGWSLKPDLSTAQIIEPLPLPSALGTRLTPLEDSTHFNVEAHPAAGCPVQALPSQPLRASVVPAPALTHAPAHGGAVLADLVSTPPEDSAAPTAAADLRSTASRSPQPDHYAHWPGTTVEESLPVAVLREVASAQIASARADTDRSRVADPAGQSSVAVLQLIEHESSAPSTGHGLERTLNRQSSPAAIRALQVQQAIEAENAPRVQVIPAADATSATNPMSSAPRMLSAPVACETNLGSLSLPAASDEKLLSNFTAQTLRGLTAMLHQRGGSMTLRLDPPDLGELRIHMTITRGVVVADFQASASHTQSLLDRNLTMLRHSLEGQGLTVERLTVHAPTSGGNSHLGNFARDDSAPSQHSWSNQHDAAGSESRGRREHSEAAHREPWFSPEIDAREVSFASLMDFSDRTKSRRSIRAIAP